MFYKRIIFYKELIGKKSSVTFFFKKREPCLDTKSCINYNFYLINLKCSVLSLGNPLFLAECVDVGWESSWVAPRPYHTRVLVVTSVVWVPHKTV